MKKVLVFLSVALAIAMSLSSFVFADALNVVPNPNITVPFVTPNVDGNIDAAGEGYSVAANFSNDTCGHYWEHNPMTTKADLYYAYDNDGLYVAASVVEGLPAIDMAGIDVTGFNQFNYSTGADDLDFDPETGETDYGWNGDIMGIMVDPLGKFLEEGFVGNDDRTAWYMVTLFEGDVAKVYKTQTSADGEITDKCKAAGHKTSDGWMFEVMIPWDMIVEDTTDCSGGFIKITKEDIVKDNSPMRIGAMYHDRFFDEEQGGLGTWGRYIVVPQTLATGIPGPGSVGTSVLCYGIEATLGVGDGVGNKTNDGKTESNTNTNTNTNTNSNTNTNTNTNKKPTTGSSTGSNAAQTLDMSIVVALGALATSGLGIAVCKKRR